MNKKILALILFIFTLLVAVVTFFVFRSNILNLPISLNDPNLNPSVSIEPTTVVEQGTAGNSDPYWKTEEILKEGNWQSDENINQNVKVYIMSSNNDSGNKKTSLLSDIKGFDILSSDQYYQDWFLLANGTYQKGNGLFVFNDFYTGYSESSSLIFMTKYLITLESISAPATIFDPNKVVAEVMLQATN